MFTSFKLKISQLLGIIAIKEWIKTNTIEVRIALLVVFMLVILYEIFEFLFSKTAFTKLSDSIREFINTIQKFILELKELRSTVEMLKDQANLKEKLDTVMTNSNESVSYWETTKNLFYSIWDNSCWFFNIWIKMAADTLITLRDTSVHIINYSYEKFPSAVIVCFRGFATCFLILLVTHAGSSLIKNIPGVKTISFFSFLDETIFQNIIKVTSKPWWNKTFPSLAGNSIGLRVDALHSKIDSLGTLIMQNIKTSKSLKQAIDVSQSNTTGMIGFFTQTMLAKNLALYSQLLTLTAIAYKSSISTDILAKAFKVIIDSNEIIQELSPENLELAGIQNSPQILEQLQEIRDKFQRLCDTENTIPSEMYSTEFDKIENTTTELNSIRDEILNMIHQFENRNIPTDISADFADEINQRAARFEDHTQNLPNTQPNVKVEEIEEDG